MMQDPPVGLNPLFDPSQNLDFDVGPRYAVVKSTIGSGAYGLVCKAFDTETKQMVAIKKIVNLFSSGIMETKRVLREISILRQLSHPNVISIKNILLPKTYPYRFDNCMTIYFLFWIDCHIHFFVIISSKFSSKYESDIWSLIFFENHKN